MRQLVRSDLDGGLRRARAQVSLTRNERTSTSIHTVFDLQRASVTTRMRTPRLKLRRSSISRSTAPPDVARNDLELTTTLTSKSPGSPSPTSRPTNLRRCSRRATSVGARWPREVPMRWSLGILRCASCSLHRVYNCITPSMLHRYRSTVAPEPRRGREKDRRDPNTK